MGAPPAPPRINERPGAATGHHAPPRATTSSPAALTWSQLRLASAPPPHARRTGGRHTTEPRLAREDTHLYVFGADGAVWAGDESRRAGIDRGRCRSGRVGAGAPARGRWRVLARRVAQLARQSAPGGAPAATDATRCPRLGRPSIPAPGAPSAHRPPPAARRPSAPIHRRVLTELLGTYYVEGG